MGLNPAKFNFSGLLARGAGAAGLAMITADSLHAAKDGHSRHYATIPKSQATVG